MILDKKRLEEIIEKLKGDDRPGHYAQVTYVDILANHIGSIEEGSKKIGKRLVDTRQRLREHKAVVKELKADNKTLRKETLREVVALLDDLWNCNCVTDESLGRSKCECVDAPANKIRKLIEDADNPRPGEKR